MKEIGKFYSYSVSYDAQTHTFNGCNESNLAVYDNLSYNKNTDFVTHNIGERITQDRLKFFMPLHVCSNTFGSVDERHGELLSGFMRFCDNFAYSATTENQQEVMGNVDIPDIE